MDLSINVISNTISRGCAEWDHEIIRKENFDWTEDAFKVAEENGAYSYVTVRNYNKTYTIV